MLNLGILAIVILLTTTTIIHRRKRRRAEEAEHLLVERINGVLGADHRSLADPMDLFQRGKQAGLTTRLHIQGPARELPRDVDLAGYRIVQEALTSALEHGTTSATVMISYQPSAITLTIDSPIGIRASRRSGVRLMRARATPLGGSVHAGPHMGGWRVIVRLPTELTPQ